LEEVRRLNFPSSFCGGKKLKIDLHVHSTGSDGTNSPKELINMAINNKIQVFSITDHDTLDGIKEINYLENVLLNDLIFIPGIEISAEFPTTLHLLGYGFDVENEKLNQALKILQEFREERNLKMIQKMQNLGFDITEKELLEEAGGELIGRPHFASLMVKKKYVKNAQEAFEKYLKRGASVYIDKKRLPYTDAIELITQAGGIVVLAHPYQIQLEGSELEQLVKQLKDVGLGGIEVYYPHHTKKMIDEYSKLAKKYDLIVTAGSDFHGENKMGIELGLEIEEQEISSFLNILRKH
jgi:predicted metal-dependent phosphoesterase TrpH